MNKENIRIYNTYHSRARRLQRRRPLQQSGAAPSHLLVNAWRFQVLLVIFVCTSPFIYLYEKVYVKMARMKYCFEILKSRGIRLDPARSLEE